MTEVLSVRRGLALDHAQVSGIGGRQSNQDAFGSAHQDDLACFVVSDGAGGHEGGEIAASIVVKAVVDSFTQTLSFGARALQSYVEYAATQVAQGKIGMDHLQEMSATVAAVLIDTQNRQVLWAHVGDTRVYFFRASKLRHMTKDHSLVQQFIDAGYAKEGDTRTHPQRNVLYAALGAESDIAPEVNQTAIDLQDRDAMLICTDGFWEWVTEDQMEACLAQAGSAAEWLTSMCRIAEQNNTASGKSRDNYTAQAVWIAESSDPATTSSTSMPDRTDTP